MLDGTYNPGQLVIVREILHADGPDFDTAKFLGPLANYTFLVDGVATNAADLDGLGLGHVITVVDGVGDDGTDRVMNVERLQFSDQSIVLGGLDRAGGLADADATPTQGQPVTVSIAGVTDADNVSATNLDGHIPPPVAYFWQVEDRPGSGVFNDITVFAALEIARVEGTTFTPTQEQVGLQIRVRAVYQDAKGVLEEVFSAPQVVANTNDAPTGAPTISDTTPTEGRALLADPATIIDPDGTTTSVFGFQWQQSADGGATWGNIAGATTALFVPAQAQVGLILRVVVSFVDDGGTAKFGGFGSD